MAIGTDMEAVPVTAAMENFSPIPRIAPPPFGSVGVGNPGTVVCDDSPFVFASEAGLSGDVGDSVRPGTFGPPIIEVARSSMSFFVRIDSLLGGR
jgi:hypothetical protein